MTTRERLKVVSGDGDPEAGESTTGARGAVRPPTRRKTAAGNRRLVVDKSRQPVKPGRLAAMEIAKMASGVLAAILLPTAAFVVADEAFESRFFLVREVEVTGLKQVDQAAVERAAGLEHPRSVLTLHEEEMRASIETIPWVKSAAVDVSLHGRVSIAIQEAELAGVVSAGELYLMDSGGDPIRRWTPADGLATTLYVGFDKASADGIRIDRASWLRARKVLTAFEESPLGKRFQVKEVQAATGNSFRLLLSTGTEIRLRDDKLSDRLARLGEAYAQLDARKETPDYLLLDGDSLQQVVFRAKQVAQVEPAVTGEEGKQPAGGGAQ